MNQPTRTCFKCGAVRPITDYPRNDKMKSGRDIRCVDCVRKHREQFEAACIDKIPRNDLKKRRYAKP